MGRRSAFPFYSSTTIPTNLTVGSQTSCTEVYLFDAGEALIGEGPAFEIALARNGVWTDASGTQSGAQSDVALLRCVCGRNFALKHSNAAALIQGVLWHL